MNDSDWTLYLIDSEEDIQSLPTSEEGKDNLARCATGSVALSSDGGTIAMLGNDNIWHKWA